MPLTSALDTVAAALDANRVPHEIRDGRIRAACPNCGNRGRRGRRPVVITERPRGLIAHADCGCRIVDIARSLDLPPSSLLSYSVEVVRSTRDATGETTDRGLPADAKPRGVTRALHKLRRGNLRAVERVAADLDPLLVGGGWRSYDSRRAARELQLDRKSVRRALDWLVARGILDERQLPARDERIVTASGRVTVKSGPKQYRLLSEREQVERLSRRG